MNDSEPENDPLRAIYDLRAAHHLLEEWIQKGADDGPPSWKWMGSLYWLAKRLGRDIAALENTTSGRREQRTVEEKLRSVDETPESTEIH